MRLFLINNGHVLIRNGDKFVSFRQVNAAKYLTFDISGIEYKDYRMDYIPKIHFDASGNNIADQGRIQAIESAIDNIDAIKAAVTNPYYEATLPEAKETKLREVMGAAEAYVLNGKPLWYIVAVMQEGTAAATAMKARAIRAKDVYLEIKADVDAAQTVQAVTEIEIENYLA